MGVFFKKDYFKCRLKIFLEFISKLRYNIKKELGSLAGQRESFLKNQTNKPKAPHMWLPLPFCSVTCWGKCEPSLRPFLPHDTSRASIYHLHRGGQMNVPLNLRKSLRVSRLHGFENSLAHSTRDAEKVEKMAQKTSSSSHSKPFPCPAIFSPSGNLFMVWCVETINMGARLGAWGKEVCRIGKGFPSFVWEVKRRWQLSQTNSSPFLPARVQVPAEARHLFLLCEDRKEISQLSSN